jgi:uncharacterized alpha-E superfamily protein
MAILDPFNPRSVAFQLSVIDGHLATLPTLHKDGVLEEPQRLAAQLDIELETAKASDLTTRFILTIEQKVEAFADAVAARYFLRRQDTAAAPEQSA